MPRIPRLLAILPTLLCLAAYAGAQSAKLQSISASVVDQVPVSLTIKLETAAPKATDVQISTASAQVRMIMPDGSKTFSRTVTIPKGKAEATIPCSALAGDKVASGTITASVGLTAADRVSTTVTLPAQVVRSMTPIYTSGIPTGVSIITKWESARNTVLKIKASDSSLVSIPTPSVTLAEGSTAANVSLSVVGAADASVQITAAFGDNAPTGSVTLQVYKVTVTSLTGNALANGAGEIFVRLNKPATRDTIVYITTPSKTVMFPNPNGAFQYYEAMTTLVRGQTVGRIEVRLGPVADKETVHLTADLLGIPDQPFSSDWDLFGVTILPTSGVGGANLAYGREYDLNLNFDIPANASNQAYRIKVDRPDVVTGLPAQVFPSAANVKLPFKLQGGPNDTPVKITLEKGSLVYVTAFVAVTPKLERLVLSESRLQSDGRISIKIDMVCNPPVPPGRAPSSALHKISVSDPAALTVPMLSLLHATSFIAGITPKWTAPPLTITVSASLNNVGKTIKLRVTSTGVTAVDE